MIQLRISLQVKWSSTENIILKDVKSRFCGLKVMFEG